MKKLLLIAILAATPAFSQWSVIDWSNLAQDYKIINQARQAYALEQQIHAMVKNPGMWRYTLQNTAMMMGRKYGVDPNLMNAGNVLILNASRQSALEAMMRASGISSLTNENATLGSLLGLQAAQATVQQTEIQAQVDAETKLQQYLQRGIGIGPQAAKISQWEMK